MQNIHIKRFANDPTVQGCIEPEDRSWQIIVDHDGFPHFYVAVKVTDEGDTGGVTHGYLAIDDMLPEDGKVKDLMLSTFGDRPTPEEEAEALRELQADIAAGKRPPCPR